MDGSSWGVGACVGGMQRSSGAPQLIGGPHEHGGWIGGGAPVYRPAGGGENLLWPYPPYTGLRSESCILERLAVGEGS